MKKVAFLYLNHIHHVYHSAPIAFTLSQHHPKIEVELVTSNPACRELLQQLGNAYPRHNCRLRWLRTPFVYRFFQRRTRPFPRISVVLKSYRALFDRYDAIVATDFDAITLKTRYGIGRPKYILASHGAGDRAYAYQPIIKSYDYVLISGLKRLQRLEKAGLVSRAKAAITGYAKFDLLGRLPAVQVPTFSNHRTTVLYNPHFNPEFSSWHRWGPEILEFFYHSDRYNLIFSPHVMLFDKPPAKLRLPRFAAANHIHIDDESRACIDMSYTRQADIYLGDVSSQVYEFLIEPRPCVFLNSGAIDWHNDENYHHWKLGPVVNRIESLPGTLPQAQQNHSDYLAIQRRLFNETFDLTHESSALRGARAIADLIV